MDEARFHKSLHAMNHREPFKPYVIEFASGNSVLVQHPEAIVAREGVSVHFSKSGELDLFDHDQVTRLRDASAADFSDAAA